jgi:hypothetical protein
MPLAKKITLNVEYGYHDPHSNDLVYRVLKITNSLTPKPKDILTPDELREWVDTLNVTVNIT